MSLDFLHLRGLKTSVSGAQYLHVGDQVFKKGRDGVPTSKISPWCL